MPDFLDSAEREYWDERAAVLEYDGEMSRADAEAMAFEEVKRKRLVEKLERHDGRK